MRALLAFVLLTGFTGAIWWQWRAAQVERVQGEALRAQIAELQRQEDEAGASAGAEAGSSRTSNAELLRLRNELRQRRAQAQEVEKLRAANQKLAAEIQHGQFTPRRLAEMEGAVPREKWVFSGFRTPESAIQSILLALASGNVDQMLRCLPPHAEEHRRKQMTEDPERFRREFVAELAPFAKLTAFRISNIRVEDGKAELDLQVTADGKPLPFILFQEDDQEWKWHP